MRQKNWTFKAVKNKLSSNKGASIFFALMLFFVCVTVSATVLIAATASSGRASQIAEVDQRYYSVRSAADLFKKQFDGGCSVVFKRSKTATTTTIYKVVVDTSNPEENARIRTLKSGPTLSNKYSVTLNGESVAKNKSIMEDIALDLLYGYNKTNANYSKKVAYSRSVAEGMTEDITRTYKINSSVTTNGELNVDVKAIIKPTGNVEIIFSSPESPDGSSFKMKMILTAHVTETLRTDKTPETSTVEGDDESGYTDTVVSSEKETKTTTIKWECTDLIVIGEEG